MLAFLERLFALLDPSPRASLLEWAGRPGSAARLCYRFLSPAGVGRFLRCTGIALREYGSLERLFEQGKEKAESFRPKKEEADFLRARLASFLAWFRDRWGPELGRERDFLFPDPMRGSACKRPNLFLRWVVRRNDGVDLGLWTALAPCDLVVPLDTHVARFARWLGLTRRQGAGWRAAEEITKELARLCPEDPLRYDFALAHMGISGRCSARRRGDCASCSLRLACRRAPRDF